MWVMIEQDERSINEASFKTDPTAGVWYDVPAISDHRHNFHYTLNFADGHAAVQAILDPRTYKVSRSSTEQSGNADLKTLATGATLPR
jgi:phosphoenolpyruvate synthase/pyruvate phosphate dikinase